MPEPVRPVRLLVLVAATVGLAAWVGVTLAQQPFRFPMNDFVEYWSASAVHLRGGNPYDGRQLLPLQREAARDPGQARAVMMWNPPWALAVLAPLGLLPPTAAHLAWLTAQLAVVVVSAHLLWRVYDGPPGRAWVAWALAVGFAPTLMLLYYGQVGGLCLLGLTGFLFFRRRQRPLAAGAFAALTALKPHLLFAFGIVLVLDAVATRAGRRALLGGALALGAAAVAAWAMNPEVYDHYRSAMGAAGSTDVQQHPKDWKLPVVSYWLRMWVAPDRFWVQFVPTLLASAWVVAHWVPRRQRWDWAAEMPRLVLVSVLAAAYGAWLFDLVVLLVPVVHAAAALARGGHPRRATVAVAGILLVNAAAVLQPPLLVPVFEWDGLYYWIWFAPAVAALYVAAAPPVAPPAGTRFVP